MVEAVHNSFEYVIASRVLCGEAIYLLCGDCFGWKKRLPRNDMIKFLQQDVSIPFSFYQAQPCGDH
jgi:hypothetical protein